MEKNQDAIILQQLIQDFELKKQNIDRQTKNGFIGEDSKKEKYFNRITINHLLQRDFNMLDFVSIDEKGQKYIRNGFVSIIIARTILSIGYKVWNDCMAKNQTTHCVLNYTNKNYNAILKLNQFQVRDSTIKNIIKKTIYALDPNTAPADVNEFPDLFHDCMIKETRDRLIATGLVKYEQFSYLNKETNKTVHSRIWFYTLEKDLCCKKTKKVQFSGIWKKLSLRKITDKVNYKFFISRQQQQFLCNVQGLENKKTLNTILQKLKCKAIELKTNKKYTDLGSNEKEKWCHWVNNLTLNI